MKTFPSALVYCVCIVYEFAKQRPDFYDYVPAYNLQQLKFVPTIIVL
jgi:hypothetical protein